MVAAAHPSGGMPTRPTSRRVTAAALCCLGALALRRASGPLGASREPLWGRAAVEVQPLNIAGAETAAPAAQGSCQAAYDAGAGVFASAVVTWKASLDNGFLITNFGDSATKTLASALKAFDREDKSKTCAGERAALEQAIMKNTAVLSERLIAFAEEIVAQEMRSRLFSEMQKRKGPLRVREKIDILRESIESFKIEGSRLRPSWDAREISLEDAERRLGQMQFEIEQTPEGQVLDKIWELDRNRALISERARGISLSLEPALRVMIRPDGIGSFQLFSEGPVGPPNNPAIMNIGILNDGSIADVYREHPEPPIFAVQPAVKVNLDVR